jgi:hypothetical protein
MITQITDNELAMQATIERLERDLVAATIRMDNDAQEIAALKSSNESYIALANTAYEITEQRTVERDALAALLDKSLYALEYASDMTKPEDMSGCNCPICTVIGEIEAIKEAK